jgi:hypothetical protein
MRGASNCGRCVDWRNQAISPAEAMQDSHRFVERQYHLRPANRRRATETSRLRQALQGVAWRHAVSMCADRCTQSGRSRRRDEAIELCDIAGFSSYAVRRSKIVRRRGMLLSLKRWDASEFEEVGVVRRRRRQKGTNKARSVRSISPAVDGINIRPGPTFHCFLDQIVGPMLPCSTVLWTVSAMERA